MATRRMLAFISQRTNRHLPLTILISVVAIILIALFGFALFISLVNLSVGRGVDFIAFLDLSVPLKWIAFPLYTTIPSILGYWRLPTINGVFLLSTLVGIIWVVIFSVAVILSNISMRITGLGSWLKRYFYVRKHPYKILAVIIAVVFFVPCMFWHLLHLVLTATG